MYVCINVHIYLHVYSFDSELPYICLYIYCTHVCYNVYTHVHLYKCIYTHVSIIYYTYDCKCNVHVCMYMCATCVNVCIEGIVEPWTGRSGVCDDIHNIL